MARGKGRGACFVSRPLAPAVARGAACLHPAAGTALYLSRLDGGSFVLDGAHSYSRLVR